VKWDAGGIATYHFDRMNIPRDIVAGQPNPDNWVSSISLGSIFQPLKNRTNLFLFLLRVRAAPSFDSLSVGKTTGNSSKLFVLNSCSIKDHFKDLSIIINTNVCGSWPEGTWSQDMSYAGQSGSAAQKTGYSSCQDYAANQGSAFNGQHWQINSIKVYQ
jgi:hypothetical protein